MLRRGVGLGSRLRCRPVCGVDPGERHGQPSSGGGQQWTAQPCGHGRVTLLRPGCARVVGPWPCRRAAVSCVLRPVPRLSGTRMRAGRRTGSCLGADVPVPVCTRSWEVAAAFPVWRRPSCGPVDCVGLPRVRVPEQHFSTCPQSGTCLSFFQNDQSFVSQHSCKTMVTSSFLADVMAPAIVAVVGAVDVFGGSRCWTGSTADRRSSRHSRRGAEAERGEWPRVHRARAVGHRLSCPLWPRTGRPEDRHTGT